MKPQQKFFILFLALAAPAMALMAFAISRYPPNNVPAWVPLSWGLYLFVTIAFVALFGRRILKIPEPQANPTSAPLRTAGAVWLVAVWSGLFLVGAFKFFKGDFPAERAVPAGILLLAFILLFVWLIRRDAKSQRADDNAPRT